jgi:CheY-like chemotaxis protein
MMNTRGRVLIVDDDREIREVLASVLADAGYEVLTAQDGRGAMDIMQESFEPLVVLLDARMPSMDGYSVLRTVADDRFLGSWHAYVLVTAEPSAVSAEMHGVLQQLDAPLLAKPFELDELLQTVEGASGRIAHLPSDTMAEGSWAAH